MDLKELKQLNRDQYLILKVMNEDKESGFYNRSFDPTGIDRKTLKKELKNLRDLGLVEYYRGMFNDDGETAGSGNGIRSDSWEKVDFLIFEYEKNYGRELLVDEKIEEAARSLYANIYDRKVEYTFSGFFYQIKNILSLKK